jgi:hypothetical protein
MANYLPKGRERMSGLGRLGGVKSGETRRRNAFTLKLAGWYAIWEPCHKRGSTDEEIAEALQPVDKRGGSHDTDWRCPRCRHFNSIKRRACAKCNSVAPANGRRTRAALRERVEEHKTAAILKEDGL